MTNDQSDDAFTGVAPTTFNWHDEPEGVIRWSIPTLLPNIDDRIFAELRERTDQWKNVELAVTINGVAVDARALLKGLERNAELEAARIAATKLHDAVELEELRATLHHLHVVLVDRAREVASRVGVLQEFDELRESY